ncbi:MAG: hypothetical protein HZC37_20420 [Burkholderiales bacterium]|nr:hypothetical protein [Burkholderiales bacterium]
MIESTWLPLAAWLLLMVLASGAGLAFVGAWPWAARARESGVALAAGLASAPLLAGLAMVSTLWVWPGAPARSQAVAVFALLGIAALAGWLTGATRRAIGYSGDLVPRGPAAVLTWGFIVALLLDSLTVPLIQNDALEYATVGRILFDSRDAASYPVLRPQLHASGFYGPWTHPPLYVALLGLGFALQGGSEQAMLMRLVAPWCLAGAAACVAALARWANPARPDDGPLAALLLVSTPMLFLGAASALIDALPVLGITLAFTALVALAGAWWQRALGIGAMLGLALWTHSQAVLVPLLTLPLLLVQGTGRSTARGTGRWTARLPAALRTGALALGLKTGALALAVALLVGAAPYWRNVGLFGSPISDNPIVFGLPSLDWPGYFKVQRGLASAAELVQYGLLKPWFALEAYGLVFWLALLALPAWWAQRRQPLPLLADGSASLRPLVLGLLALYLAGALLSVALGIDLMVRNERYMLILLPAAAIAAAGALNGPWLRRALVLLLGLQLAVLVLYRLGQLNAERGVAGTAGGGEVARLQRWGPYGAVQHLRTRTPPGNIVLSLKPADMFYAGRTMLSYLDPRLLPFYAERDPAAAAARLRELGVTHVHLPDYWLPPVYHSALEALLADPGLSELEFEAHGYQIYRLGGAPSDSRRTSCGEALPFGDWQRAREFVLGGRKNLRRIHLGSAPLAPGAESRSWNATPLFLRETNTVLRSEVALPAPAGPARAGARPEANEWLLRLELSGAGYMQAIVRPRGAGGEPQLVADLPLNADSAEGGVQLLQRRLRIDATAQRLELRLEHRADSRLRVQRASLVPICAKAAP